ncbi:PH domain-containing protein [Lamprocystis purpurea]|uniref:PH domain-containing protein n=1 Tax=Lamprocystis purpurea TaxID=61598 RepID=UPI001FDF8907|nr:PH domain-containing protein [Lamprocystis purpurea]
MLLVSAPVRAALPLRTLQVNQSLMQRMLDIGDLTIFTTGDQPELAMRGLPNPERIRSLVQGRGA